MIRAAITLELNVYELATDPHESAAVIEDRLLAPISISGVAIEKILVGILQAMIAGLVVLPLAWLLMRVHLSLGFLDIVQLVLVAILVWLGVWQLQRQGLQRPLFCARPTNE